MAKILLVGGAGYIGSHMTLQLLNAGHDVVLLDKQDASHLNAIAAAHCVQGDLPRFEAEVSVGVKVSYEGGICLQHLKS